MTKVIELDSLRYSYKTAQGLADALKGLSLSVEKGKMVALLGPNGSGKSTTFKVISTQIRKFQGRVQVAGVDAAKDIAAVRRSLGVCFQSPSLDKLLTARENLFLQGRVLGLHQEDIIQDIKDLSEAFQVNYLDKRIAEMSGGQARRVEIIKALLGGPEILLLDEPTTGLDPKARRDFWNELVSINKKRGVTIVVTTHLIEEAELCEDLIFICEGQCVAQGKASELKSKLGYEVLEFEATSLSSDQTAKLKSWLSPKDIFSINDNVVRIKSSQAESLLEKVKGEWGQSLKRFQWAKPSLSDLYFDLTGKDLV